MIKYPTITVSRGMREVLNDLYPLDRAFPVIDFQDIMLNVANEWLDENDKLNKAALTEEFFSKLISSCTDEYKKQWLLNCRKNKYFLLSAVGLLAEASIEKDDLVG